ncbi:MAG: type II toxin-antitoxin system Phd/YefM family antitoxin [Turneriella sp.]|mgnify:CR=1 FL=1
MDALLMVADFKAQFSDVLDKVRQGEEVVLGYGRKKEKIAVLVPYEKYRRTMAGATTRRAGSLAGKGKVIFQDDFKISDDDLLRA